MSGHKGIRRASSLGRAGALSALGLLLALCTLVPVAAAEPARGFNIEIDAEGSKYSIPVTVEGSRVSGTETGSSSYVDYGISFNGSLSKGHISGSIEYRGTDKSDGTGYSWSAANVDLKIQDGQVSPVELTVDYY